MLLCVCAAGSLWYYIAKITEVFILNMWACRSVTMRIEYCMVMSLCLYGLESSTGCGISLYMTAVLYRYGSMQLCAYAAISYLV